MTTTEPPLDLWRILAAADAASPVDAIEAVATELAQSFGADAVSFLIADMGGRALIRLGHVTSPNSAAGVRIDEEESATPFPLDGGPAEQTLRTQTVQVLSPGDAHGIADRWRVLAPVTERGDVIGLLEMTLAEKPTAETLSTIARVGHLLSHVVSSNSRHTDLFEWGQRSRPVTLSAEIQHRLLPLSRTCEAAAFTLAGWLEPAASIGGDTFDYSLARDLLHFSLTDAMGHGVGSSLTATVGVSSLRGSRRAGATLVEAVQEANAALCRHAARAGEDDFATGLIGRVDLKNRVLEVVNAGHAVPFLIRSGQVSEVDLTPDLPLGMFADTVYSSTQVVLVPGDRMVFVTDGMLERRGSLVDLPRILAETGRLHPREAVRHMADEALEAAGHQLADDATILCLDWHGDHVDQDDDHGDPGRSAVAGADPWRASAPLD